jgi:riboflavin synthase
VTAIKETLDKTNLGQWKVGTSINLERSMTAEKRLDGHFVQGHVDTTTQCISYVEEDGSWRYRFALPQSDHKLIVSKGSVCINGVSLTVVDPDETSFGVAIIPYTYEHTTFKDLREGSIVNIEYDVLGKYVSRYIGAYLPS